VASQGRTACQSGPIHGVIIKMMLAVVWNIEGLHIVEILLKGAMFDIDYDCKDILSEILRACPVHSNRRLTIPTNYIKPHTSK
jgi:hypothetical protein